MNPRGILYIARSASIGDENRVLMDLAAGLCRDAFFPLILSLDDGPLEAWAAGHEIPVLTMRRGDAALAQAARDHGVALVHAMAPECARLARMVGDLLDVPHSCHVPRPAVDTRIFRPAPVNWEAHLRLRGGAGHVVVILDPSAGGRWWQGAADDISSRLPDCRFLTLDGCREERADVLRAADVVVLPSLDAERPRDLLEAMACAKPVVAAPIGRLPDALVDEQTGLIVPVHQPERLADAVLRVLSDRPLSQRIGLAGRVRAQAQFSVHRLVVVIQAIYGEMIDRFEPARQPVPSVETLDEDLLGDEDDRESSGVTVQ